MLLRKVLVQDQDNYTYEIYSIYSNISNVTNTVNHFYPSSGIPVHPHYGWMALAFDSYDNFCDQQVQVAYCVCDITDMQFFLVVFFWVFKVLMNVTTGH